MGYIWEAMFRDREYFTALFKLALPMIAQNFIASFLNFIDIIMIGQSGEAAVAGVGLANQIFFIMTLLLFGLSSSAIIYSAQYWGQRDIPNIRKVLGINLIFSLGAGLIFSIGAVAFSSQILGLYSQDPAVIAVGSRYLRTAGMSYGFTAVTFCYAFILRSTENVRLPMMVNIGALSLKTLLNYALIFGNFGLPALGPFGAALATLIARFLECVIFLSLVYILKTPVAARPAEMLAFQRPFLVKFIKTALPVALGELMWSVGITVYNIVYARIGTDAIAAVNISATIEELAFVVFIGISDAVAIILGNRIGARQEEKAFNYARWTFLLGLFGSLAVGGVVLSSISKFLTLYKVSPLSHEYATAILTIFSLTLWLRVGNMLMIAGFFRSGGDTRFAFVLDIGFIWLIGVPLALLGGFVFHLEVYWVYLLVLTEELGKYIVGVIRFTSRKWINNLIHNG
jgi:putative MATE family efflux protein